MENRKNISTGTLWERHFGYSRAVRVGNFVEVAGTTALDGEEVMFPRDHYNQTQYILLKIQQSLHDVGARMEDVVRTRIFVTSIDSWEEVGRAHAEFFREIRPVSSFYEVYSLIRDDLVVEIEVTAIVSEPSK